MYRIDTVKSIIRRRASLGLYVALQILFIGCQTQPVQSQVVLQEAFPNLSFARPVDLQNAGDGSNRIFVVEQAGIINVFPNDSAVNSAGVFLDIRNRVDDSRNEEGLLGLAFHPRYAQNGYFYVNYTADSPNRTVIARYTVSANDPNQADPNSEVVLMTIPRPFSNHNAGALAFGPNDGYLYITTGDGGGGGDPLNNGQNRQTWLGSILRINVDSTQAGLNYAIPADNPFYNNNQGYLEEIYAYGLRNPWRISFDPVDGRLWAADVGQDRYEEIDVIVSGGNYGWRVMEGAHCFNPPNGCDVSGKILPIWEYDHSLGISITGGYVYRGPALPELTGKYIYADFGSGRIWALEYDGVNPPVNLELLNSSLNISSFGVDENRELYLCAFDGKIYRLRRSPTGLEQGGISPPTHWRLGDNFPDPFNPATHMEVGIKNAEWVTLTVFDQLGREVRTLVDQLLSAGTHRLRWDGRDEQGDPAPSGVYFYQLRLANRVMETRSMVLLK